VFIGGSFVLNKKSPQDINLLLIMKESFIVDEVSSEVKKDI